MSRQEIKRKATHDQPEPTEVNVSEAPSMESVIRIIDPPTRVNQLTTFGVVLYFHCREDSGHGPISGLQSAADWFRNHDDGPNPLLRVERHVGQSCVVHRPSNVTTPTIRESVPDSVVESDDPDRVEEAGQLLHQMVSELEITDGVIDGDPLIDAHPTSNHHNIATHVFRAMSRWAWVEVPEDYEWDHYDDHTDYVPLYADLYDFYAGGKDDVLDQISTIIHHPPIADWPDESDFEDDPLHRSTSSIHIDGVPYSVSELTPHHVSRMDDPYASFFYNAGINHISEMIDDELQTVSGEIPGGVDREGH